MGRAEFALAAVVLASGAQAQQTAPPPPRLPVDGPGAVTLAPLPADRAELMEEIIVIGRDAWNLPELGGTPRAPEPPGPWDIHWLPLYDPAAPLQDIGLLQAATEQQRGNFIELFRVRFGAAPTRPSETP